MEPVGQPAYLVGHQARLLKGLCRLVLAYVRWRVSPWGPTYAAMAEAADQMESLLDGKKKI